MRAGEITLLVARFQAADDRHLHRQSRSAVRRFDRLEPAKKTPKLPLKLRPIALAERDRLGTGPGDRASGRIDLGKEFQVVTDKRCEQDQAIDFAGIRRSWKNAPSPPMETPTIQIS